MADRERTVWKLKTGIYEAAEWGEVTVSNTDTVTIGSLVATSNPYNVVLWKMSDGIILRGTEFDIHGDQRIIRCRNNGWIYGSTDVQIFLHDLGGRQVTIFVDILFSIYEIIFANEDLCGI